MARRWDGVPGLRGARSGPQQTDGSSIDAVREHPVRVREQRRHQHVKRSFNRRIVSIEVGGRLLEPMTESRSVGKPGECPIESGSGRVQSQPSTLEHAVEPRPVPNRDGVGLSFHLSADMLDEDIEIHPRVVHPAPRETVVEEYVHDDPRIAPAGSGDTSEARLECVVTVRESVDGAVECDSGRNSGRNGAFDFALDEVGADVPRAYLVVVR